MSLYILENKKYYNDIMDMKSNTFLLQVPGIKTSLVVDGLEPYTVYNVTSVVAENAHGKSLPSYSLLVLTLSHR